MPPPPAPVAGIDVDFIHKGDVAKFDGTLMGDVYLTYYLQWKHKNCQQ